MELDLARQRQEAHRLIDVLPEDKLHAVSTLLKVLVEPPTLADSLASAPYEDEDLTPETIASIERARISLQCGEGIPHEDVRRDFTS